MTYLDCRLVCHPLPALQCTQLSSQITGNINKSTTNLSNSFTNSIYVIVLQSDLKIWIKFKFWYGWCCRGRLSSDRDEGEEIDRSSWISFKIEEARYSLLDQQKKKEEVATKAYSELAHYHYQYQTPAPALYQHHYSVEEDPPSSYIIR